MTCTCDLGLVERRSPFCGQGEMESLWHLVSFALSRGAVPDSRDGPCQEPKTGTKNFSQAGPLALRLCAHGQLGNADVDDYWLTGFPGFPPQKLVVFIETDFLGGPNREAEETLTYRAEPPRL